MYTLLWHIGIALLLLRASDIETNPGPRVPKYPCGVCSRAVRWTEIAVKAGSMLPAWGMCDEIYFTQTSNVSWVFCTCGLPSFSSDLFDYVPAESANQNRSYLVDLSHTSTDTMPSCQNRPQVNMLMAL